MHLRILCFAAIVGAAGTGWLPKAQSRDVPPLAHEERFVQQEGLKITLTLPESRLEVGADPRFTLGFENIGTTPLYVNPYVAPDVRITRRSGEPAPVAYSSIESRAVPPILKATELIRLAPGARWETRVAPAFPGGRYAQHGYTRDAGWGLLLPPGEYLARFVYVSAPGVAAAYDVYQMPAGIWEGRSETPPLSFEVAAATPEQLKRHLLRLRHPNGAERFSLLRFLSLSPRELVEEFKANVDDHDVMHAAAMHPPAVSDMVLEAVYGMAPKDLQTVLYSSGLQSLMQVRANCRLLMFLSGTLASNRGEVVHAFRPVFEKAAAQCPEVRVRLRDMLNDRELDPYARGNAAAMLGTFTQPDDVPLLRSALERKLAGTPGPSLAQGDPIAKGAAAGLAMIGGAAAREALSRALADEQRNFIIGPELVNRLGGLGGDEAIEPLISALSSANANIVVAAIGALTQLRAPATTQHLTKLLTHKNPTIRSCAANALWAINTAGYAAQMRAAANDIDQNVQGYALLYLAKHGQPSDLNLFLSHMDSRNQYVREGARAGVSRFGTEAVFPHLRKLLDIAHGGVHGSVQETLRQLGFVGHGPPMSLKDWDSWYARRRGRTRVDWAREAVDAQIQAPASNYQPFRSHIAIDYLAAQDAGASRGPFERAAASGHADLRVTAARQLAVADRTRALGLLVREFDSRYPGACWSANAALNELTGRKQTVECTDPAERARARDEWTRLTARR